VLRHAKLWAEKQQVPSDKFEKKRVKRVQPICSEMAKAAVLETNGFQVELTGSIHENNYAMM
jgi:hypothetical protein